MALEIRPITPDEIDDRIRADAIGFGSHPFEDLIHLHRPSIVPERSLAVFDGGKIVGGTQWDPHEMTVPGGSITMAGITAVSVQPTHRRRGLLTQMTDRQLRDIYERGLALAGLFAAESIIYGRFGYGTGAVHERWTIERQHTAYATALEPRGRIAFVQPDEAREGFPDVYRRATANRPGAVPRPAAGWDLMVADPEPWRRGASANFYVSYNQDGDVDGYVVYRIKGETVQVQELMAATDEAYAALWRFCFDIDLRTSTAAHARPVDDPLPWMLADPRRLRREPSDALWFRLVDVPSALAGRRYAQEGNLVFDVRDSFCEWNEGRYELEAGPDDSQCRATKASPDLVLSVADLGAVYLGAVGFSTLSRAGRVQERTPGALWLADRMFATQLQPWCPNDF